MKGAIFDLDGTLLDSMKIWDTVGEQYLNSMGVTAQPGLSARLAELSLMQAAEYLKATYLPDVSCSEIIAGINRIVEDFYVNTVQPKPGVIDFLESLLLSRIKMCIATASDLPLVKAALKRTNMDRFFVSVVTCSSVGCGKDNPLIFEAALDALNVDKKDAVVFEDAIYAARTAKNAGFLVAGVFDQSEPRQDELRDLTDYYICDFSNAEVFLHEKGIDYRRFGFQWRRRNTGRYKNYNRP